MPLSYGGGVKSVEQAQRIFSLGVEKIAMSASVVDNPNLITEMAEQVGTQSVVAVVDVKKKLLGGYEVFTHNGRVNSKKDPVDFVCELERLGAGEIVINSIDNDGVMKGYDLNLVDKVRSATSLPLTVLGGAGSLSDVGALIKKHGLVGAAVGSLFVFKGVYKAVLINYPSPTEKDALIKANMCH